LKIKGEPGSTTISSKLFLLGRKIGDYPVKIIYPV